jgi:cytidylate kinase
MPNKQKVISIDGPAYVGKSSIAKALSDLTGFSDIKTGHMYRSLGRLATETGVSLSDEAALTALAGSMVFKFVAARPTTQTWVNGENWTQALDDHRWVRAATAVSVHAGVRKILTDQQREFAKKEWIIMEGRDVGSQIFPNAAWKFYVTANEDIRAKRMWKMLSEDKKSRVEYKDYIPEIRRMDDADRNRPVSPLVIPEGAIVYDNSDSPTAQEDAGVLFSYLDAGLRIRQNARSNR